MIFGYIRVSDEDQNPQRQIEALKDYEKELKNENIYMDKQSGKDFNRDNYLELKKILRDGDTLIVKELDRFGIKITSDGMHNKENIIITKWLN